MPTMDIAVFQTQSLTSYCDSNYNDSFRAANRAKTWIEGAFDNTTNYTASVSIANSTPDPKNRIITNDIHTMLYLLM